MSKFLNSMQTVIAEPSADRRRTKIVHLNDKPLCKTAPNPVEPWEGIKDAIAEGNVAPQINFFKSKEYIGNEDCLFLNIYTPKLDDDLLPVMIYIHGGGMAFDSGNEEMYGPDYLIEKDVVIVTINYRLGALGFLCLDIPEIPGNSGLKDVVLALKWIKDNIKNFGGDHNNLTVFGQSAGGAIVSVLSVCPLTKEVISKAIIQSRTALSSWTFQDDPIGNAKKLAEILGFQSEDMDDLKEFLTKVPAKDIVQAQSKLQTDTGSPFPFVLVVERDFSGVESVICEPFKDLLMTTEIPIIIGSTTLELATNQTTDLIAFIPKELNIKTNSDEAAAIAKDIEKLYFKDKTKEECLIEYHQLFSDAFLNISTHRYIKHLLNTKSTIYQYKFDYIGELNISPNIPEISNGLKASMHLDDLGYLFKNYFQNDVEPTPKDLVMRERMVSLWTNFAKTGNPTPEDKNNILTTTWPPVTRENLYYLNLGEELTVKTNPDQEKMDFWDALYEIYLGSAKN